MSLFAELYQHLVNNKGPTGIYSSTGIATDFYNQFFFSDLCDRKQY
jgi:hypothetical protein